MQRRDFLKIGAGSLAYPLFSERFGNAAWALGSSAEKNAASGDKVLVVVRLDGGNDALSMVLPLDRYDNLAKARPNVLIPAVKGLKLTDTTALHPNMPGMQSLFKEGKLAIVQAVGYPNHNQSHFRSTDIFFTASDYNQVLDSGWIGRYLDTLYPGFPEGYPKTEFPDPPAIQIGSVLSTLLQGENSPVGMTVSNPTSIYTLIPAGVDTAPNTPAGHELTFIRNMFQQTQKYGDALKNAIAKSTSLSTLWPTGKNSLADQLKAVARCIAGGLKTPVYVVTLGGFDTHASQVEATDITAGRHGILMATLSEAITAFQDELKLNALEDRVMGVTVSEFGRRILSNASLGTDHGTSAAVLLFGKTVKGGIVGDSPAIPDTTTVNNNVPLQTDFRSIYTTILQGHFGLTAAAAKNILLKDFPTLPLLAAGINDEKRTHGYLKLQGGPIALHGDQASLHFSLPQAGYAEIELFDMRGGQVSRVAGHYGSGPQSINLNTGHLSSGQYLCRLKATQGQTESLVEITP